MSAHASDSSATARASGEISSDPWRACPVHVRISGRSRFIVRRLQRAEALAQEVATQLQRQRDIEHVRVSTRTGSVLVHHAAAVTWHMIQRRLEELLISIRSRQGHAFVHTETQLNHAPESTPQVPRPIQTGQSVNEDWHSASAADVLQYLNSRREGLNTAEAALRLQRDGPNTLEKIEGTSQLELLSRQVFTPPVALLGVAFALSIATGGLLDALVIAAVVGANTAIGYLTERNSESVIRSLASTAPGSATVMRNGSAVTIGAADIVLGDILRLTPGLIMPADARLVSTQSLCMDESALTGESLPVDKTAEKIVDPVANLADRCNMTYRGTTVVGGSATAIVVACGNRTETGRIQVALGRLPSPQTPMQIELDRLGRDLAIASSAGCLAFAGIGLVRRLPPLEVAKSAVSLGVAAVPEGLPAIATTTLALGIRKMRSSRVTVRRLNAIEALGTINVLCLDKTGTLTENRMAVVTIRSARRRYSVTASGFERKKRLLATTLTDETLRRLLEIIALCNESVPAAPGKASGSSTENALLEAAMLGKVDPEEIRRRFPRVATEYRSPQRPFMRTLHEHANGTRLIAVKGRPDVVLDRCDWYQDGDQQPALSDRRRRRILRENEDWAGQALRVLGVAWAVCEKDEVPGNVRLTWLGLVSMTDPLRHGLVDVIARLHSAGIRTAMITGDQTATAYAIADKLGLSGSEQLNILESKDLKNIDPPLFSALAKRTHVFARVSPTDKLDIVKALQDGGDAVAMTGDGINDGPALRVANVGIAMGGTPQDVARSVADIVLQDDDLSTILKAIEHGRTIHANIRKSIRFLLSTNLSELEVMLVAGLLGLPAPASAIQLLWLNIVTDVLPALVLSQEPAEPDVLDKPSREPHEPILPRRELGTLAGESFVLTAGTIASYVYALVRYGPGTRAQTHAFTSMTVNGLLHAFNCRSPDKRLFSDPALAPNAGLNLAVAASIAVQLATIAVPPLRRLLKLSPVSPTDLLVMLGSAVVPLIVNDRLKATRRTRNTTDPEVTVR